MASLNKSNQLRRIIELDCELNQTKDLDLLMERILKEARKLTNADAGSIYVVENNMLHIKYTQNDTIQKKLPSGQKLIYSIFKLPLNTKTISGYTACTGKTINLADVYKIPPNSSFSYDPSYDKIANYRTKSILSIPLGTISGKIIGVIQMINAKNKAGKIVPFKKSDELLVNHFALNASTALERAQMTRTIILRMIRMAELRDPKETGSHVNRVGAYAVEIYDAYARKHHLPEKEVERNRDLLRMAAMLHDVGKVAISDTILKKPARFTKKEFEIMKAHTYLGSRLFFDEQSEFDKMAQVIALSHHEKWNGEGYPGKINIFTGQPLAKSQRSRPLKKTEIPLWGRIVAIADVFDALSSARVYKDAWPEEKVVEEFEKLSGKSFDPELVELFLGVLPNIRQIKERYSD